MELKMRLLNLGSPWSPLFSHNHPSSPFSKPSHSLSFLLFGSSFKNPSPKPPNFLFSTLSVSPNFKTRASDGGIGNGVSENPSYSSLLNDTLLNRVLVASADAAEALQMITEMSEKRGGVVGSFDCFPIIAATLDSNAVVGVGDADVVGEEKQTVVGVGDADRGGDGDCRSKIHLEGGE